MKIVATTLGETLGDYISITFKLGYAVGIGITLVFFLFFLSLQIFSKKFILILYWLVIIGTTTLGTEISDFIDRSFGLGYAVGSALLLSLLLLTLFLWHKKYNNLQVYPITERQKEVFYWTAILFSNSLGTAFGDYLSDDVGLSYLTGAIVTGCIIVLVILLHKFTKINQILLFWLAFIFTQPFGATFGNFLTKPHTAGGLDLGTLQSSLISILIMALLIGWSHFQNRTQNTEI